ncbi:MAG: Hpt domain-containing protein, partial [Amphiplicatus sp.]
MTEGDSSGNGVEFIKAPNVIKSKVKVGGPGAVDEETLERAESVISKEANNYFHLVKEDLSKLRRTMAALKADPGEPQPALEDLFFVAHTIKGQAGSFGYDLLTRIADRLCRVIEYLDDIGPKELQVM